MKFENMPKLQSPFERELINNKYICIPKIKEEYRWVFTDESIAVEKLDGTNVSLWIRDGKPFQIMNRTNVIDFWNIKNIRFIEGVLTAIDRKYIVPELCDNGGVFGELIGKKIQGNPYKIDGHLWIPFDYLIKKYKYNFWNELVKEFKGASDKSIFTTMSDLFTKLWSLYKRQRNIKGEVSRNIRFEMAAAEGIVFYRKGYENKYNSCCKLRRDMFDWFTGSSHKR